MLFRTKYVSGVYHTLGINIIISERLKFLMKRCASVLSASSNIGISEEGEGEQPQIPRKQLSLWKKYRAPFLNHNKAKWMFWYQQERQHQIVLNSACDSPVPCLQLLHVHLQVAAWLLQSLDMNNKVHWGLLYEFTFPFETEDRMITYEERCWNSEYLDEVWHPLGPHGSAKRKLHATVYHACLFFVPCNDCIWFLH